MVRAPGVYSTNAAICILAREFQGEPLGSLPRIHQEIQDLTTPIAAGNLKSLARGLFSISKHVFPDSYLVDGFEHLLIQHTINILHYAMPPPL